MSFKFGEHGKMVEMFAKCPRCNLLLMIVYEDGAKLCECGYHGLGEKANEKP